jgi:hypothetical protein
MYYQRGNCKKGSQCTFEHRVRLCKYDLRGGCKKESSCTFGHSPSRPAPSLFHLLKLPRPPETHAWEPLLAWLAGISNDLVVAKHWYPGGKEQFKQDHNQLGSYAYSGFNCPSVSTEERMKEPSCVAFQEHVYARVLVMHENFLRELEKFK